MKQLGLHHIIVCSNYYPGLTLTYLTAMSNLRHRFYIEKNVRVMDSLEIITTFELAIDELMKVYEVPLTFAEHHIDFLGQNIR